MTTKRKPRLTKVAAEHAKAMLVHLVKERIAEAPVERGGVLWAKFYPDAVAATTGISLKSLQRWTGEPPFQKEIASDGGVRVTLLRVLEEGEAPIMTPQCLANVMRKIWMDKVGTELDGNQHGCLIGLAKVWPEGHQVPIFKTILNGWGAFASAVKHYIECLADEQNIELASDSGQLLYKRYYKMPTITYIRAFPEVGVAVYAMTLMNAAKSVPHEVMTIYQSLEMF